MLTALTLALLCGTPDEETPPADLGATGIVIDFPAPGAALTGQWTQVTGWLDPKRVQFVAISGAPRDGFYLPTGGHMPIPMVFLTLRPDGRFIAPRVPLAEGANTLTLLPLGQGGFLEPMSIAVTAQKTETLPATITATPETGEVPVTVTFKASAVGAKSWQWDFEGKGTFEETASKHLYGAPGQYRAVARTRVDDRWVYGVAAVSLTRASTVVFETKQVSSPSLLKLVEFPRLESGEPHDPVVKFVLAIDGGEVKVFDHALKFLFKLKGLKHPMGVDGTADGKIYVADTGNDRILCFDGKGALDPTFGDKGALKLKDPRSLLVTSRPGDPLEFLVVLGTDGHLYTCKELKCREDSFSRNSPVRLKGFSAPVESSDLRSAALETVDGWATLDIVDRPKPLSKLPMVVAGGCCGSSYFLGIDARGTLSEMLGKATRTQKLPFAVTAAAVDVRPSILGARGGSYGPVHVYLAGKGVLQRRVFDAISASE